MTPTVAEPKRVQVLHFADFLEAPRRRVSPPAGLALAAPERAGLGAVPAPALGSDEPTVLDPEVWFAEAARLDAPEAPTVVVPDDVLRVAQELADEARRGPWGSPPGTVILDPGLLLDAAPGEAQGEPALGRRRWRGPRRFLAPGALALAAAGLLFAPLALSQRSAAIAPPARPAPEAPEALSPVSAEATAPRFETPSLLSARPSRRGRALAAPTARADRGGEAAGLLRRGRRAFDRQDYRAAESWYRQAARALPGAAEPLFGAALAAYEGHRDGRARRTLDAALALDPDHPDSNLLLGFMEQEAGRAPAAGARYERYLALAPDGAWADDVRAVLAQLGR